MPENGGKQKKLIIEIHFNDWGGTPERTTRNWIEKRLALFMTCTRKSLQLQTSQDFSCYVIYDPASERIIREILDRYVPLPRNIQFVTPRGYYAHVAEDIAGYDCYYRVYLSSDDMYHKDFIRRLHAYTPKKYSRIGPPIRLHLRFGATPAGQIFLLAAELRRDNP